MSKQRTKDVCNILLTVIYSFDHKRVMKQKNNEHSAIYQNYINKKYKATHKRVTDTEFYLLPKIFINEDYVSIVTGKQHTGGKAYIEHCKSFDVSVDRKNGVILLVNKSKR